MAVYHFEYNRFGVFEASPMTLHKQTRFSKREKNGKMHQCGFKAFFKTSIKVIDRNEQMKTIVNDQS
jgi:hypothetical protein